MTLRERLRALERDVAARDAEQTAISEVLRVMSSSPVDAR